MSPTRSLLRSRKFLVLLLDTVVSIVLYFGARYLAPEVFEEMKFLIGAMQPVFVALIAAIAWEDNNQRNNPGANLRDR